MSWLPSRPRTLVALALMGGSGCSLAFPADQAQCTTDQDCTSRGGAFAGSVCVANACVAPTGHPDAHADARADGTTKPKPDAAHDAGHDVGTTTDAGADAAFDNDWSCLGHVTYPDATTGTFPLTVPYTEYLGAKPLVGLRVQTCLRVDPSCSSPVTDAGYTNDAGVVTFAVPSGYNGYLLADWDASIPDLVYIDPPVFAPTTFHTQGLLATSTIGLLAGAIGKVDGSTITVNPSDGIVFLGSRDCKGELAGGVSFSMDPVESGDLLIYITGGLPSLASMMTDQGGAAAYINVPPGSVTITATLVATGERIGSANGYVEANSISGFSLAPSP